MLLQACRHLGRLLFLLILLSTIAIAATPGMTTITDTVYRADGLPASGTVLISWPAFNSAENQAVAPGTLSVNLGPQGALNLDLVPNAGATPSGTLYRVVYKRMTTPPRRNTGPSALRRRQRSPPSVPLSPPEPRPPSPPSNMSTPRSRPIAPTSIPPSPRSARDHSSARPATS